MGKFGSPLVDNIPLVDIYNIFLRGLLLERFHQY
jgi:hypothetical protein